MWMWVCAAGVFIVVGTSLRFTDALTVERWVLVVLSLFAGAVVYVGSRSDFRTRPERLRMRGGALMCWAVCAGAVSALFGVDSAYRVLVLIVASSYVLVGGSLEYLEHRKRDK